MFWPIWSSLGDTKIDVENCCSSVNEYNSKDALEYVPMCCMFIICNENCVSISCMEYTGISHNVVLMCTYL